jgi:ATP-dependent phosphoenolpyruvate carboxykinase
MPKFIKPFKGVLDGEIYPKTFEVDDECPPELEGAARLAKVLEKSADPASSSAPPAA